MAISIHPYLTGVPHRIKYLEMLYDYILGHEGVVMWTGARDPRLVQVADLTPHDMFGGVGKVSGSCGSRCQSYSAASTAASATARPASRDTR